MLPNILNVLLFSLAVSLACAEVGDNAFRFLEEPDDIILGQTSETLNCSYELDKRSGLQAVTEWTKDGVLLQGATGKSLNVDKPIDEGVYQCAVKLLQNGKVLWIYLSRRSRVMQQRLGNFISQPRNQKAFVNQTVSFRCSASIIGPPTNLTVEWYHNNHRVVPGSGGVAVLPVSQTLELANVQLNHSGTYKCVVRLKDYSIASQTAVLAVIKGVLPNHITIHTKPLDVDVSADQPVILECLAQGNPKPKVSWFFESRPVSMTGMRLVGVDRSNLLVEKVRPENVGKYTCVAANGKDKQASSAQVQVRSAPRLLSVPVSVTKTETEDVQFECTSSGSPKPKVTWMKNGELIVPSEYFTIEEGRLRISGLIRDDQGIYQCFAENESGSTQASARLTVQQAATKLALLSQQEIDNLPPSGLHVQSVGGRSMKLKWNAPIGSALPDELRYVVLYRTVDSTSEVMYNTTSPSATLLNLVPDTMYKIKVAVVNQGKKGPVSDEISASTKEERIVIGKVRNLRTQVVSSSSAEVSWDPPTESVPNMKYKLFYKKSEPSDELETQSVVVKTLYTLHGLSKNTDYMVRVQTVGPDGQGVSSEKVQFRTFTDIPDGPPLYVKAETRSSNSLVVRWSPPSETHQNGPIIGYKIRYKAKGVKAVTVNAEPSAKDIVLNNLHPGVSYQVRVAAQTQNGTGAFSEWVTGQTQTENEVESIPGAPAELQLFPTADAIHLTWSPPSHNGIVVRGYIIGWGLYVPDMEKGQVGGDVFEYVINDLKPGREYVVSLRAVNNAGTGFPIYETVRNDDPTTFLYKNSSETEVVIDGLQPNTQYEFAVSRANSVEWSMSTLCKTGPTAPSSAPRDLTVVPNPTGSRHDPNTVTLSWQPPKYANGEIEEYIVLYSDKRNVPDREWIVEPVKGDRLSTQIDNLQPRAEYYFKIQARNVKGYGPLSSIVTYRPGRVAFNSPNQSHGQSEDDLVVLLNRVFKDYLPYIAVVSICTLLSVLLLLLILFCTQKCNSKKPSTRKLSRGTPQKDCWITHPSNRVELLDLPPSTANELKRLTSHADSPISHYQGLGNGTVPRNYHQSSGSLESRQRTPQILYTGSTRQQITRVDLGSDKGSSFGGSNTGLPTGTSTPPVPDSAYQTVRVNPLRSFINGTPTMNLYASNTGIVNEPRLASVRPVVVASASSMTSARPVAKLSNTVLPIGRAQAQPRVNMSAYSPNSSVDGSRENCADGQEDDILQCKRRSEQTSSPTAVNHDDLNPSQFENMIGQLQQLQQDFEH